MLLFINLHETQYTYKMYPMGTNNIWHLRIYSIRKFINSNINPFSPSTTTFIPFEYLLFVHSVAWISFVSFFTTALNHLNVKVSQVKIKFIFIMYRITYTTTYSIIIIDVCQ